MIFNVGVSGTGSTITVQYPIGAICKCRNGNTILTALDTSGAAVFNIPYLGAWTVYLEGDIKSDEQVVNVTAGGTNYPVSMQLTLYSNGAISGVAGGYVGLNILGYQSHVQNFSDHLEFWGTDGSDADSRMRSANAVNLTGYNTLHSEVYRSAHACRMRVGAGSGFGSTKDVHIPNGTSYAEYTMDISDLNGNYYVGFFFTFEDRGHMRKMWLTQ